MNDIERAAIYVVIIFVALFLLTALFVAAKELLGAKAETSPPQEADAGASPLESAKTLNRFFKANLSQLRVMFWASLTAMALGLLVTVIGVITQNQLGQIIVVILGAIGQFVAITFLAAYRSTVTQSLQFTQALERLSNITTALNLIQSIGDQEKRDSVLADTAKILAANRLLPSADGVVNAATKS